jgi:LysM repeat protein
LKYKLKKIFNGDGQRQSTIIEIFIPSLYRLKRKQYCLKFLSFLIPVKPFAMLKRSFVFFFALLFTGINIYAQHKPLIVEGNQPDIYLIHIVSPKENFYSIGRMYNISPKELASFNNLQFADGLRIGQTLKIPLTQYNFSQTGEKGSDDALIPVYHVVQPHEGLYRVSLNFNKIPLTRLRTWNHLQSDELSVGTSLIVGYLKVSKIQSPLADENVNIENAGDNEEKKNDHPPYTDQSHERLPPVKVPEKEPEPKQEVAPEQLSSSEVQPSTQTEEKSTVNFSGGFFKRLYDLQASTEAPLTGFGTAGTFKSTSGWEDGKYYCFSNDAPPGTYVKVTCNATQKSIYAKVLDAIPDIKQNEGLSIIISNAAATELGSGDVFACSYNYVK